MALSFSVFYCYAVVECLQLLGLYGSLIIRLLHIVKFVTYHDAFRFDLSILVWSFSIIAIFDFDAVAHNFTPYIEFYFIILLYIPCSLHTYNLEFRYVSQYNSFIFYEFSSFFLLIWCFHVNLLYYRDAKPNILRFWDWFIV